MSNEFHTLDHKIFAALIQIKGIGYQTLYNFMQSGKKLQSLLKTKNHSEFNLILGRVIEYPDLFINDWQAFLKNLVVSGEKYLEILAQNDIKLLLKSNKMFPKLPIDMDLPLFWLFVQGNLSNLSNNFALTLVGSREMSPIGNFLVESFLFGIVNVKESIVTISGLANGIDQLVHDLSIFLGIPTIAVLGNGHFHNYPENSKGLRQRILQTGGTIISEYFPETKPSNKSFVHRNRIQAALADVVIPMEWKRKSGTAHTIRFANAMRKKIVLVETPACQKYSTEQHLANAEALKKYSAQLYIMPIEILKLIETLKLNIKENIGNKNNIVRQMDLGF
ncbi:MULTISPECIES: DNA-processing protein DprA [Acinetobacter calcoaceticus/baumannii complex]|uniref:DNA-processing protein DprA n=1 Tax=Acinetobacter calcoaceticus/baumannii complex TaxID=909768 RepID=UPI00124C343D|nr:MULTISPECIES: DNA-processing protein DprA [Acinetobacter calcoaceticus/baumannii complex]MBT8176267.1 DNA-protecting protein DprA [Acinetobacter baumannii]